jgi:ribosomal protein S18 acetylase RimI-like enzyme
MLTDQLCLLRLDSTWIPRALLLSEEAGWNQNAADWEVFLRHGTVLGFSIGDLLVATAAALPYGDNFGWISMVLVTAEWRRNGLATRLVAACTSLLRDAGRAALLDAAPAGTAIYAALGFIPLGTLERWEGHGGGCVAATAPANLVLDQFAFGADRCFLLENFLSRPRSLAFASPHGFAILRQGSSASQLGPVVGEPTEAHALVTEAIRAASGRVVVDVLDAGRVLIPTLTAHGFHRLRCFTRMALGLDVLPGNPSQLMAAAGPEFG